MIVQLRTNQSAPDTELDIGTFVPGLGGFLEFLDPADQQEVFDSTDVRALTQDNAFPGPPDPSAHTLILNVDGQDVPPGEIDAVAGNVPFTGATLTTDGTQGLVPQPTAGQQDFYLAGDGTWKPLSGLSLQLPNLEQPTPPTSLQLPDGFWLFWYDTSTNQLFLVRRRGSDLHQVELTIEP